MATFRHERSSLLSALASGPSPCVLNAASFPAVCRAEDPLTWPIGQLTSEVVSPASGLQALLNAEVTDITVYHRPGGPVTHDYLIFCIRTVGSHSLDGLCRVWARCERNPGTIAGGVAKLYRRAAPAVDTIKFSVDRPKLKAEGDVAIMMCAYDALTFAHVADLLRIIRTVSPHYGLASYNCWWYAAVTINALEALASDWTIKPSKDWGKRAIQALGKSTQEASQKVARSFAEKWLCKGAASPISNQTVEPNTLAVPPYMSPSQSTMLTCSQNIPCPIDSVIRRAGSLARPPVPPRPLFIPANVTQLPGTPHTRELTQSLPPSDEIWPNVLEHKIYLSEPVNRSVPPPVPPRPLPARFEKYSDQKSRHTDPPASELGFYPPFGPGAAILERVSSLPAEPAQRGSSGPPGYWSIFPAPNQDATETASPNDASHSKQFSSSPFEPFELSEEQSSIQQLLPSYDTAENDAIPSVIHFSSNDRSNSSLEEPEKEQTATFEPQMNHIIDTGAISDALGSLEKSAYHQAVMRREMVQGKAQAIEMNDVGDSGAKQDSSRLPDYGPLEYHQADTCRQLADSLDSLLRFSEGSTLLSLQLAIRSAKIPELEPRILLAVNILQGLLREKSDDAERNGVPDARIEKPPDTTNNQNKGFDSSNVIHPKDTLLHANISSPSPIRNTVGKEIHENISQTTAQCPFTPTTSDIEVTGPQGAREMTPENRLVLHRILHPTQRRSGDVIVQAINNRLRVLTNDPAIRITTLSYSKRGRPVVTTIPGVDARRLAPFANAIFQSISGQARNVCGYSDRRLYRVKLNGVPTKLPGGQAIDVSQIMSKLCPVTGTDRASLLTMKLAHPPSWIIPAAKLEYKHHSTVVLSFLFASDAQRFQGTQGYVLFGTRCQTSYYSERPPTRSNSLLHLNSHLAPVCTKIPRSGSGRGGSTDSMVTCIPPAMNKRNTPRPKISVFNWKPAGIGKALERKSL